MVFISVGFGYVLGWLFLVRLLVVSKVIDVVYNLWTVDRMLGVSLSLLSSIHGWVIMVLNFFT